MIIGSFGGIIPRLADHMLALNQATIAHDVNLRNGQLEPWREPCLFSDVTDKTDKTIYLYGCCLLHWSDLVNCAELTPDWGRLYLTGREGNGLEVALVSCDCGVEYVKTGVAAPTSPPVANAGEQCSRDASARSYVYTYVTEWGEESAPSLPSNVVRIDEGSAVFLSGIQPAPDGYHVIAINIYRTASGFRVPDGKVQQMQTDYQLVTTIGPTATTYTDTANQMDLGPVLETQYDRPPPMMAGVISIGDQVRLAGYACNRIYLSEPFQPHNWPAKYDLTLDFNIVHMLNQDQRLFVTTDSIPYIIDVSSCDDTKCTPVTSFELPLPDIGCHYAHGAIMTHHGMFYATPFGIVLIQPNGEWHIITSKWFGEREWLKLRPDTIRMAYWEGYLFFATDMATFLLNINGRPYGDMDGTELVTLSDKPIDMITTNTGKLLFLEDGKVWEWDGGTSYRSYIWQTRRLTAKSLQGRSELAMQGPVRDIMWWPTAVRLRGAAKVTLFDSRGHDYYRHEIANETPHRLPRHGRHMWYQMRLDGSSPVEFVSLGTSLSTVNAGE